MFEDMSDEWKEWLELFPIERFRESEKIFAQYLAMGGSLDPDPDLTSPFYDPETSSSGARQMVTASRFVQSQQIQLLLVNSRGKENLLSPSLLKCVEERGI